MQTFFKQELDNIKKNNLLRSLQVFDLPTSPYTNLNGKMVLNLASNNYLGYANHPEINQASIKAIQNYGTGSGSSRLITGTSPIHEALEKQIALFKNTESSLFFSSGYVANLTTISSIMSKEDVIFSDELNHASIIDGIKLSRANKYIYKHNNLEDLERLLNYNRNNYKKSLIITDTIFSMDGDKAKLAEIVDLKEKYNCAIMVDEAHATGLFGKNGSGLVSELNLCSKVDIQMGTFSKALGVEGAYIAGSKNLTDFLINKSRGFIYSTAPSPIIVAANLKALEIVQKDHTNREKLWASIQYLKEQLDAIDSRGFWKITPSHSAIFGIIFNSIETTQKFQKELLEQYAIFTSAIRPPTVKESRIRFCLRADINKQELDLFTKALNNITESFCQTI